VKHTVRIWDALNSTEEDDAVEIAIEVFSGYPGYPKGLDPFSGDPPTESELLQAAERFVEQRWAESDYLDCTRVLVRRADGRLFGYDVHAETIVHFRAVPIESA